MDKYFCPKLINTRKSFFFRKKIFYFSGFFQNRCITSHNFVKSEKVIFLKNFLNRLYNGQKFICAKITKKCLEKMKKRPYNFVEMFFIQKILTQIIDVCQNDFSDFCSYNFVGKNFCESIQDFWHFYTDEFQRIFVPTFCRHKI
jgi:hypothetical protein